MSKEKAREFTAYSQAKLDELVARAQEFYSNAPSAPGGAVVDIIRSRTLAEREAIANLVSFAQGQSNLQPQDAGQISLLVDQLRANAPLALPTPETEIANLQALRALITRRIEALQDNSA